MKFKAGDKVALTESYLLASSYKSRQLMKDGGIIIRCCVVDGCVIVRYTSGYTRHTPIWSVSLKPTKNQQLLFKFME